MWSWEDPQLLLTVAAALPRSVQSHGAKTPQVQGSMGAGGDISSSHWVGCQVFSWQIPIKQTDSGCCSCTSCWPWEPSPPVWRCNSLQPCLFSGHRVARLTVQLSVHLGMVRCFNLPANCDSQLELTVNKYLWKNSPSVSPEEAQDPGAGVWGCLSHCWVPAWANKGTGGGVSVTEFLWVKSGLTESETIPSSDAWFSTSWFLHQRALFVSAKLEIHTTYFSRIQKVCVCIYVYIYMYKVQNLQAIILTPSSLFVTSCHVAVQQLFLESQAWNWAQRCLVQFRGMGCTGDAGMPSCGEGVVGSLCGGF